jgi:hypothetical protein
MVFLSAWEKSFIAFYSTEDESWEYDSVSTSEWEYQEKYNVKLDSSRMDGSLTISTPQALSYITHNFDADDTPASGQMKLSGAQDTSILVTFSTVGSTPVARVQVDTNNDGNYECDESDISQADLENGNWSCSASGSAY